ncbi:MAG: trehalose-phosphatase [Ilumatobacter sp.]|nr:trehalose-phosphatase [Ilumatobacter sp.]
MNAVDITPERLAAEVAPVLGSALIGFDVDGVLAPIVEKAHDAALSPGVLDELERLAMRARVVIVSGRSVGDLDRFSFPPTLEVVGSHGLERRGMPPLALDDDERYTFEQLELLATRAVDAAGEGAWLEYKPASVVIHVREADRELAERAIEAVGNLASMIDGAHVKHGHMVCELLARTGSKGDAISELREPGQPVVFLGDDVTDESVFEAMVDGDLGVRVGDGETAAGYRLSGPDAVVEFLHRL